MEENQQKADIREEAADNYHKEPKQNYIIYTIISILLFAVLYSGAQIVKSKLFGDYKIIVSGSELAQEQQESICEYTGLNFDNIEHLILKQERSFISAEILYNIGDYDSFSEDYADFAEAENDEEVRLAIYPYGNDVPEYVYAKSFVNINNPDMCCYIYEYGESSYAKLTFSDIPSGIRSIFAKREKIYLEE